MTNTATDARQTHDSDATVTRHSNDTLLRPHTVASITLEVGVGKRTVQRWVKQCGDIGALKNNVPHFSDAEKARILSHRAKPKQTEETIEAELVEPGAIELHTGNTSAAAPLIAFDLQPVQLSIPESDIAALQAQTAQLKPAAQQGANAINQYFAARMQLGVAQIAAEQDNLLAGIRANALNIGAQSLSSEGKS